MATNLNIDTEIIYNLNKYLENIKNKWDEQNPVKSTWSSLNKTYLLNCTIFLISSLDDIIVYVQKVIPKGSDKKAAVMSIVSSVFDYIVVQAFPIWLKPFAPTIKQIIIGIVISQLIEFIVTKYKEGSWKMETKDE